MKEKEFSSGQKAYFTRVINEFKEESKSILDSIKKLKDKIIVGTDEEPSIIEKIESAEKEISNMKDEIESTHSLIFEENEDGEILSEEIESFKENFEKKKKEIINIQDEIIKYQNDLFGIQNEDGSEIKGTKHKIDGLVKNLEELYKNNDTKQEELFNEIEGLLKGASTVALAKAFNEHKESFNTPNIVWIIIFVFAVLSMMAFTLIVFFNSDFNISEMWKYTLGNLPFIGGAVWLAIYASKQRSQNVRLQQEYAYKEDVAKIYYGLKKEIEDLGDSELGQKLNEKILSIILDMVSYNPSQTLESEKHNDKGPILESLKEIQKFMSNHKS